MLGNYDIEVNLALVLSNERKGESFYMLKICKLKIRQNLTPYLDWQIRPKRPQYILSIYDLTKRLWSWIKRSSEKFSIEDIIMTGLFGVWIIMCVVLFCLGIAATFIVIQGMLS